MVLVMPNSPFHRLRVYEYSRLRGRCADYRTGAVIGSVAMVASRVLLMINCFERLFGSVAIHSPYCFKIGGDLLGLITPTPDSPLPRKASHGLPVVSRGCPYGFRQEANPSNFVHFRLLMIGRRRRSGTVSRTILAFFLTGSMRRWPPWTRGNRCHCATSRTSHWSVGEARRSVPDSTSCLRRDSGRSLEGLR